MLIFFSAKKTLNGKEIPIFFDAENKETTDPDRGIKYKLTNEKGFNEEWKKYMEEDYIIDITPANQQTINEVKKIVLETKEQFSNQMAEMYNDWCEAYEKI